MIIFDEQLTNWFEKEYNVTIDLKKVYGELQKQLSNYSPKVCLIRLPERRSAGLTAFYDFLVKTGWQLRWWLPDNKLQLRDTLSELILATDEEQDIIIFTTHKDVRRMFTEAAQLALHGETSTPLKDSDNFTITDSEWLEIFIINNELTK